MPPDLQTIAHLCKTLPPTKFRKTIVFDLDETLIHCVENPDIDLPQVSIDIKFHDEPEPVKAGINIRPGALDCLKHANRYFQVVVFTASE